jgi:putative endonuclease
MHSNFSYVYVLQSATDRNRFYTGLAADLRERIAAHNRGQVRYTSQWKPWILKTYVGFRDRTRAADFERYLKSASGRAFVKRRL